MNPIRPLYAGMFAVAVGACNGSQGSVKHPEGPAPTSVEGTPTKPGDAVLPGTSLEPVPELGEVVLHVRWKNPAATLDTVARYAKLPGDLADRMPRDITREFLSEAIRDKVKVDELAEIVAADAPIDAVLVADLSKPGQVPKLMPAWSIGLTSLDRALQASKGEPKKLANGAYKIGTKQKWGDPCAVAPAMGKAPVRLVCTDSDKDLERITAYVARNVAARPDAQSDLHGELELRGLVDKYGRQWANMARGLPILAEEIKIKIPIFDEAVKEAATALGAEAGELLADAQGAVLDANLDEQRGLTVDLELKFAGKRSWVVQTMLDGADTAGVAPDLFWHAPKGSDSLSYNRTGDPARWDPVLRIGRALIEGGLEYAQVAAPADRKALAALLKSPLKKNAVMVVASGHVDSQGGGKNPVQDIANATMGWTLIGIDDKPAAIRAWLDELVKAYNRAGLQQWIKKEMGAEDAKHLPIVKVGKAPAALGKDSMAIEITVPGVPDPTDMKPVDDPDAKQKTVDIKGYVLLMGDGERTWVGVAADRDALTKVMVMAKGATPGGDTIAASNDAALQRFRNEKHAAVSLTSIEGIVGMIKPGLLATMRAAPGGARELEQIVQILESMPNKGKSLITAVADVDAGGKPSVTVRFQAPRQSLEDVGYLVMQGLMMAKPVSRP
jgi:hypothetical protein